MSKRTRDAGLDAARGLAMGLMILVNNAGDWSHVYAPLRHAEWHGFTLADLVFPLVRVPPSRYLQQREVSNQGEPK